MADLQTSEKWNDPWCRWLKTGGYVIATRDDEALFRAASQMAFIDLTEAGTEYHHGRMAPAYRVGLTDRGKEAAAKCGKGSESTSWGVAVSTRRFGSGRFVKQEPGGRTVYEVDFAWVPTPVGDQVLHVLTGPLAVKEGEFRAKVFMQKASYEAGANGWRVDTIDDRSAQRLR